MDDSQLYRPPEHSFNIDKYQNVINVISADGGQQREKDYPEYQGRFEADNVVVDRAPQQHG